MFKSGDVILAKVQYTDTSEVKVRPALVLFEELGNIVVAGITSNVKMKGISLKKKDGAFKDSVIKINYLFTISSSMVVKPLFSLKADKGKEVYRELMNRLSILQ